MLTVTRFRLQKILQDRIELADAAGKVVRLDRMDVDDPNRFDFTSDGTLEKYFDDHSAIVAAFTETPEGQAIPVAKCFSISSASYMNRIFLLGFDVPVEMQVEDTNSQRYAFGPLPNALEGRVEKRSIRKLLQDKKVFPRRIVRGYEKKSVALDQLLAADIYDDEFWCLHYPEYELTPGDTVVGYVRSYEIDETDESIHAVLDLPEYIDLRTGQQADVLHRLGLRLETREITSLAQVSTISHDTPQTSTAITPASSVLVLDDEVQGSLKFMSPNLQRRVRHAVMCARADEARDIVEKMQAGKPTASFDVALIDINLQNGSGEHKGLAYATWLQSRMPKCSLFLITGEGVSTKHQAKIDAAANLQVVDIIAKPFGLRELDQIICEKWRNAPVSARELLSSSLHPGSGQGEAIRKSRDLHLASVVSVLDRFRSEIGADMAAVFRMHKVSRGVSILGIAGPPFPRFSQNSRSLRYSPVRDVCEEREEWCHNTELIARFAGKHQNLLDLFNRWQTYTHCVACPVLDPPGSESWYALFGFKIPPHSNLGEGSAFRVEYLPPEIPEQCRSRIRDTTILYIAREHAAYVAQHLLEEWHEETQMRQHPFMMAGMSSTAIGHDIANHVMGIEQAAKGLLRLQHGQTVDQDTIATVTFIAEKAERAVSSGRKLASHARAHEEGVSRFRLLDAVNSVLMSLAFEAEQSKVQRSSGGDDIELECPRGAVERILFNLILNAIQQVGLSLRKCGTVHVVCFRRQQKRKRQVVVQIYDTGPGIQGYRQRLVFQPGETTREDGSGMGLPIARAEARQLKGSVSIAKSILFCGTCFELVLPNQLCPTNS